MDHLILTSKNMRFPSLDHGFHFSTTGPWCRYFNRSVSLSDDGTVPPMKPSASVSHTHPAQTNTTQMCTAHCLISLRFHHRTGHVTFLKLLKVTTKDPEEHLMTSVNLPHLPQLNRHGWICLWYRFLMNRLPLYFLHPWHTSHSELWSDLRLTWCKLPSRGSGRGPGGSFPWGLLEPGSSKLQTRRMTMMPSKVVELKNWSKTSSIIASTQEKVRGQNLYGRVRVYVLWLVYISLCEGGVNY